MTGKELSAGDRVFSKAVVDSRIAETGMLFAAIPGELTDGHKFIGSAFEQGASAALVQEDVSEEFFCLDLRDENGSLPEIPKSDIPVCIRVNDTVEALQKTAAFHRRQLTGMEVIGITGTVGKTTTKELIYDVLSTRYRTLKTPGNMNNEIGLPLTLLSTENNTEQAILEMGFYVPGEIEQLCRIAVPSVGVITNVGMVHASRAGSMEVIARGKSELIRALPSDGTAILNYDDPYVRPMAELTDAGVLYYGEDPAADLYTSDVESHGLSGISFCLNYKGQKHSMQTPLVGRHSVMTAMRAAATGIVKGLSWDEIEAGLLGGRNQLRMRITRTTGGGLLIDDTYNASPESTLAALNLLSEMKGRKIAVLGEMRELGQYEKKGHEMVGIRAAAVCDTVVAVGPVTRYLADAALGAGMPADKVHWFETTAEAGEFLKKDYGTDTDAMLIKGSRGMRMEQIVSLLEEKK